jgi:heme/copper-type cytochrome/quinol oxidase subunit 4
MWIGFALLTFISLIALAVIPADKFTSKFSLCMACLRRILVLAAFIHFFRHMILSFRLSVQFSLAFRAVIMHFKRGDSAGLENY